MSHFHFTQPTYGRAMLLCREFKIFQWSQKWGVVWWVESRNLKKKTCKILIHILTPLYPAAPIHNPYLPPHHHKAQPLSSNALRICKSLTDVATTIHVLRICNICRICNTCTSHMQHMLHMQHMSHMQHMCFAYATYVAYATHFYKMWFFFKSARWNIF